MRAARLFLIGDATLGQVEAVGREAVSVADLMPGVAALVDEVRLEVLMGDGARLVVVVDPFGLAQASDSAAQPGAVLPEEAELAVYGSSDTYEGSADRAVLREPTRKRRST